MNLFDMFTLFWGDKKLRRKTMPASENCLQEYHQKAHEIIILYTAAAYWHGTGRYHYKHQGDSRYAAIDHTQHIDLLESMVVKGGLAPHLDPWIKIRGNITESISLTPYRMYARLYAGLHQNEHESFRYEYGGTKFWFRFFLIVQIFYKNFLAHFLTYSIPKLMRRNMYRDTRQWMSALRSDIHQKPLPVFGSYKLRSDIKGNYAILIGIKKEAVIPLPIKAGYGRLETRTADLIRFADMTHIEVPFSNLKETEEFLRSRNVHVKVLPIEIGEIYCSTQPLEKLSYPRN